MSEDQVLTFIEDEYKPACRAKGYKYVDHTAAVRTWLGKRKGNGNIRKETPHEERDRKCREFFERLENEETITTLV